MNALGMRRAANCIVGVALWAGVAFAWPQATFPAWAYPWDPAFKFAAAVDDGPRRVPGSAVTYTLREVRNSFFSADWHPEDHGPMPEVVALGRKPEVHACGTCHRADGVGGGPAIANLAGLPAEYIVQQIADFRSGARALAGPPRTSMTLMLASVKAATDAEVRAAAEYFAALKPRRSVRVVEAASVPKTHVAMHFLVVSPGSESEPIGQRIVEVPHDVDQMLLRNARAQFTAYVPPGSIARGEALVRTGGQGQTTPCITCHGPELRGLGPIPGLVGNSPTYLFRQLHDFRRGTRAGVAGAPMKAVVQPLDVADMVSIAAFLGSLAP